MPTITVYECYGLIGIQQILNALHNTRIGNSWITAKPSKYTKHEVFIQYFWYEDIEDGLKKIFSDEESEEIVTFLKRNGKTQVLKRVYCFINFLTKTLEVYRGPDKKTDEIVNNLSKLLKVKFKRLTIDSGTLQEIFTRHSTELKQAMFKNIDGLLYEILRGQKLEQNEKFKSYLQKFPSCLRVISFRPNIKFLNGGKYQVTLNGDKGTVKLSSNGLFQWRPRFEIRQIVFLIAATLGLLSH